MKLDDGIYILDSKEFTMGDGSKKYWVVLTGPSSATKPTAEPITNGSVYIESDTGNVVFYDETAGWPA